jgi:hypothetical protein
VGAAALLYAPPARANGTVAEDLFRAGQALVKEGKIAEGCAKFEASQREDPSPGTLVNLAHCYELEGRLATAWSTYERARVAAHAAGRTDVEGPAKELGSQLEPRLSRLEIDATPADTPGLTVQNDAEQVDPGAFGVPIAIDPGEHTIRATAPGFKPWSAKVTIGKEKDSQKIVIPKLEKDAGAVGAQSNSAGTRRTAGFAIAGVGVAGVALGAVTRILASNKINNTKNDPSLCVNGFCNAQGGDAIHSANTLTTVSTVGFIAGAVAIAGGITLIVTAGSPKKSEPASALMLTPVVGQGGGGFSFATSF